MAVLDTLKLRRNEALTRLQRNLAGLVLILVATPLLPLPTPWAALRALWRTPAAPTFSTLRPGAVYRTASSPPSWARSTHTNVGGWGGAAAAGGAWWRGICFVELVIVGVMCLNVLQAAYALWSPPAPLPPPPTPAKATPLGSSKPAKTQRKLAEIAPNPALSSSQSHHPQKPFSSSVYAASPVSTPSRQLYYSLPPDASFNSSLNSSVGSISGSPVLSSPLAAYRGKHRAGAGRAFDGDRLVRLAASVADEDE